MSVIQTVIKQERLEIVSFLEKQLFPAGAKRPEMMCHLSYEIWEDFKKVNYCHLKETACD